MAAHQRVPEVGDGFWHHGARVGCWCGEGEGGEEESCREGELHCGMWWFSAVVVGCWSCVVCGGDGLCL